MRFIFFILFFTMGATGLSQTQVIDSLRSELGGQINAQDSFAVIHMLCEQFNEQYIRTDSIKKYGSAALSIARQEQDSWKVGIGLIYFGAGHFKSDSSLFYGSLRKGINLLVTNKDFINAAIGYHLMGFQEMYAGEFTTMRSYGQKGIQLLEAESDNGNKRLAGIRATLHGLICSSFQKSGKLLDALESALETRKFALISQDKKLIYSSLLSLSATYGDMSDEEKHYGTAEDRKKYKPIARQYMLEAYAFARNSDFDKSSSVSAFNLAVAYSIDKDFNTSDSFLQEAISLGIQTKFSLLLYNCYTLKGQNFLEQLEYDSASIYLDYARRYAEAMASSNLILKSNIELANAAFHRGDLQKAEQQLNAILPNIQNEDDRLRRKKVYAILADIKEKQGQWKDALHYFKLKELIADSIMNSKSFDNIEHLRSQHELELHALEIDKLNQQKELDQLKIKRKNNTIFFILFGCVLMTGLVYYYYRSLAIKEKHLAIRAQQKLLRTQLNPHFLFNSLNSIQQFIYAKKDPNMIADYLGKFSRLTRRILQYSQEEYVSLADEAGFLRDYLDLQKIRFDIPFDYDIIFDNEIEEEEFLIPPLFTQPFIENSIEHGILNKQEKGRINIRFSKNKTQLLVTMTDNGVGREVAAFRKRNQKHRSLATKITRDRIRVIEKRLRKKATLAIRDLREKDLVIGTEVVVTLPLIHA